MKVVSDSFPHADKVLEELFEFMSSAETMKEHLIPYSIGGNKRALPRFITETSVALRQSLISDFVISFPSIHSLVENGNTESMSLSRLHDAIFKFDVVQKAVHKANCVIMADDDRSQLCEKLNDVIGDLAVFTIVQYNLYKLDTGDVTVSVHAHCEKVGITPDILLGSLTDMLAEAGRTWYAYEPISPLYDALDACDPVFMAECEEALYPLTDAMATKIVDGDMDIAFARSQFAAHMKNMVEEELNVTPTTLLEQMRLD